MYIITAAAFLLYFNFLLYYSSTWFYVQLFILFPYPKHCFHSHRSHKRRIEEEEDHYDKRLVDTESTTSDIHKMTNVNNVYTTVEKRNHIRHIHEGDSDSDVTELYNLEDLPRVTALNDEDVHSIDSALLSATEQELVDSSSGDIDLSSDEESDNTIAKHLTTLTNLGLDTTSTLQVENQNKKLAKELKRLTIDMNDTPKLQMATNIINPPHGL